MKKVVSLIYFLIKDGNSLNQRRKAQGRWESQRLPRGAAAAKAREEEEEEEEETPSQ